MVNRKHIVWLELLMSSMLPSWTSYQGRILVLWRPASTLFRTPFRTMSAADSRATHEMRAVGAALVNAPQLDFHALNPHAALSRTNIISIERRAQGNACVFLQFAHTMLCLSLNLVFSSLCSIILSCHPIRILGLVDGLRMNTN